MTPSRRRRLWARRYLLRAVAVASALALMVLASLVVAPAAGAAPFDCKESPTPEVPGRGLTGFFEPDPGELPPPGDPFAPNATTSIYEQYGYAGLRWSTYDLGCGPDAARNPEAVVGTTMANWVFQLAKTGAAATNAVVGAAFEPTFLSVFDPLVTDVVNALQTGLFEQWVPLSLAALGLLLVYKSRRASLSTSTAAVGWALLVLMVTAAVVRWPLEAGRFADESVTATLSSVTHSLSPSGSQSASPAAASAANVHEALLYRAWLAGTFGDSESPVAREYGPKIFDAQALTWAEARILREDPARGAEIIDAKQHEFSEAASKIKDADPDAYEYLTGKRSDDRLGWALLAGFGALCALPFLLVAALLLIGALLIVRFAVMLLPAFATLGVFPAARGLVLGIGSTVAAALVNGTIFGIAAIVVVRVIGLILRPQSGLPAWLAPLLMLVVSVVLWVATKPFRRLTTMVPAGRNVFADAAGGLGTTARAGGARMRQAGAAVAAATGNAAALVLADRVTDDDEDEPSSRRPRVEEQSARDPEPAGAGASAGALAAAKTTSTSASTAPSSAGVDAAATRAADDASMAAGGIAAPAGPVPAADATDVNQRRLSAAARHNAGPPVEATVQSSSAPATSEPPRSPAAPPRPEATEHSRPAPVGSETPAPDGFREETATRPVAAAAQKVSAPAKTRTGQVKDDGLYRPPSVAPATPSDDVPDYVELPEDQEDAMIYRPAPEHAEDRG